MYTIFDHTPVIKRSLLHGQHSICHMDDNQVVPALISGAPLYWQVQSQAVENFIVPPGEEWNRYCHKLQDTMPNATIKQITRIQNRVIWERYSEEKKRLRAKNRGVVNELELFHGCRRTDPLKISNSEEGFDVRHSQGGSWGFANYFAANANYSDKYAYYTPQGEKDMFVAKVILGEIFDCREKKDIHSESHPLKNCNQHPWSM